MSDDEDSDTVAESATDLEEELGRIQQECSAMVKLLKNLEKEEHDLQCQLEILAREALLCGFDPEVLEPPAPKRRKTGNANT